MSRVVLAHLVIFAALIVNLWLAGDVVEAWLGRYVRTGFEVTLILGYLWFIVGIRVIRRSRGRDGDEGPSGAP